MSESPSEHFQRTVGNVPPPIATLVEHAPEFLDGYVRARTFIMDDAPDGLDLATKELVFVILDVVYDNEVGALNHLDAALRAGLSPRALLEALLQTFLVGGIATWGKSGHRVFDAAVERYDAARP